jgi:hypothetical protein
MKNWETRRFHHSAFFILHSLWLFQIVAAINDAGVEEAAGTTLTPALSRPTGEGVFAGGARLRRALTN